MSFVVNLISLGRPDDAFRTARQSAFEDAKILIACGYGEYAEYASRLTEKDKRRISVLEQPANVSHRGCGPARRWAMTAIGTFNPEASVYIVSDDDIFVKQGALWVLADAVQDPLVGIATHAPEAGGKHLYQDVWELKRNWASQLIAVRANVYWEVGGYSSLSRAEDTEFLIRTTIAGYRTVYDARLRIRSEFFSPQGGMYQAEMLDVPFGAKPPTPRQLALQRQAEAYRELAKRYPGIVAPTGRWRLHGPKLREYQQLYRDGKIALDPDRGILFL